MDAISTATDIGSLTPEDAAAAAEACDLLLAAGDSDPHLQVDGGAQVEVAAGGGRAAAGHAGAEMARGNAGRLLPVQTGADHAAGGPLPERIAAVSDWSAGETSDSVS